MEETTTVQTPQTFVIGEAINAGWNTAKKYFGISLLLLLVVLAPSVIQVLIEMIIKIAVPGSTVMVEGQYQFVGIWFIIVAIVTLVVNIASMWISIGYIKSNLLLLADTKPSVQTFTSTSWIQVLRMIGSTILYTITVVVGLVLLIVPGLYVAIKFSLTQYYVAEGYGIIDAMKASRAATKGNFWKLIGFGIVNAGVMLLGAIALGVGLLWAIPTVALAQVYMYKALKQNTPSDLKPLAE